MSDKDTSALIDQKPIASFEKLYASKGSRAPQSLDDDFAAAYFSAVEAEVSEAAAAPSPHKTTTNLCSSDKDLKEVVIPDKNKKFLVRSQTSSEQLSNW